jgi:uncharacterized protein
MSLTQQLIDKYKLQPHPEGGWYTQTYKSIGTIPSCSVPEEFPDSRPYSTAIYFLLEKGNYSAFHRIKSDECWHFYYGDPLEIFVLKQNGELQIITLANNFEETQHFQFIVPANSWFASRPAAGSAFSFVGCTVSPGFTFEDFELAKQTELISTFPTHKEIIIQLCR